MKQFISPIENKQYHLKEFTIGGSDHMVHALSCGCGKTYKGKTNRPLKLRLPEHRSNISPNRIGAPLAEHFTEQSQTHRFLMWDYIQI